MKTGKRIDLHVHTKKMFKGDGIKRNIEPEEFKKKMIGNKVGIVSITNHNYFEVEYFNKFISENDYELLPGVEIDVEYKGQGKQLNIIVPSEEAKYLEGVILQTKPSLKNKLTFADLIKFFDKENFVFYLDYKNSRRWNQSDIEEINREQKIKNALVVFDTNNSKTQFVLRSNKQLSLIGSDVQNWDDYEEKNVPKLLFSRVVNLNFKMLVKLLKYDKEALGKVLKEEEKIFEEDKFFIDKENDYLIENFYIRKGVNIIFGPKASGKTTIIKAIYETNSDKSILYESKNYEDKFESIKSDLKGKLDKIEKDKIQLLKDTIDKISNYEEIVYKNFSNFYNGINSKKTIKIAETSIKNISKNQFQQVKGISTKTYDLVHEIKNQKFKNMNEKIFANLFKPISEILWKEYIKENKDFIISKILKKALKSISKILEKKKGDIAIPSTIGLFDRWNNRSVLIQNIRSLSKIKYEKTRIVKEYRIPFRNSVSELKRTFKTLPFGQEIKDDFFAKRKIKTIYEKSFLKLFKLKTIDIGEKIQKTIESIKNTKDDKNVFDSIKEGLYWVRNEFFDVGTNKISKFSSGEKAFIALDHVLEQNEKEILLLDEPSSFLETRIISEAILPKISNLRERNKTLVMTTHSSILGINTIPDSMIFRKTEQVLKSKNYKTFIGNYFEMAFIQTDDIKTKLEWKDTLINNFEGGKKHYLFRKDTYGFEDNN